jgi:hypothetical protein
MAFHHRVPLRAAVAHGPAVGLQGRVRAVFNPGSVNRHFDLGSIGLGLMIFWFAAVHFRLWIAHPGVFVGAGQVTLEVVQGVLLFIRRRDTTGRRPASVWAAATIGSWAFLLARPIGGGYFDSPALFGAQPLLGADGLWLGLQFVGTICAIFSLTCLGRSFGLLAGNRGVKTQGAYQIVRHPAYASYMLVQLGYVLENPSLWNIGIFAVVIVGQLTRIHQEEETLSRDPRYVRYARQVRNRLVPGIY